MDTGTIQRVQCRHCGCHQVLYVTATKHIEHALIGGQYSGAGGAAHANPHLRKPGDLIYSARRILTDPKKNAIVRHTNKLRRFISWPFR